MDTLRSHTLFRHGILAVIVGTGLYTAPLMFAADSSLFGFNLFQFFAPLFTIVLAFAALRIEDRSLRHTVTLGTALGFALLEVLTLGFTSVTVLFLALVILFAVLEYPQASSKVRAYSRG